MFGHPLYVWIPPVCLGALMFGCSLYVWTPPVCLDDVWMPPVHTQHKETCSVMLRECPYAPMHLDAPIFLDAPCMFKCPHMFGYPLYVWMHPICLDTPLVCLDAPMCGHPHMFGHHPYVMMSSVCLDTPMFGCPHMFGHHPYIWMPWCMLGCPPVCLVAPICVALLATLFSLLQCLDAPSMFCCPHMFGHHPFFKIFLRVLVLHYFFLKSERRSDFKYIDALNWVKRTMSPVLTVVKLSLCKYLDIHA